MIELIFNCEYCSNYSWMSESKKIQIGDWNYEARFLKNMNLLILQKINPDGSLAGELRIESSSGKVTVDQKTLEQIEVFPVEYCYTWYEKGNLNHNQFSSGWKPTKKEALESNPVHVSAENFGGNSLAIQGKGFSQLWHHGIEF